MRIVEHAVHEIHGKVVAHDDFLGQTVQNPEHGDAELAARQEELLVEEKRKNNSKENRK